MINPSLEVRVLLSSSFSSSSSAKGEMTKSTKIRPVSFLSSSSSSSSVTVDFSRDPSMAFSLRPANYNYHSTFVQLLLFHNEQPAPSSSILLLPGVANRAERMFVAHALLGLSDVHPMVMQQQQQQKGRGKRKKEKVQAAVAPRYKDKNQ